MQLEARDDGFEDAAVFLEILRRAGGGYGEEPVFLLGNDPQGPDRGLGGAVLVLVDDPEIGVFDVSGDVPHHAVAGHGRRPGPDGFLDHVLSGFGDVGDGHPGPGAADRPA